MLLTAYTCVHSDPLNPRNPLHLFSAPDYTATTVDFTFGPGVSRQCVNVSIEDDIPLENTETFFGNLTTTDAGVTLNPDTAQVDIIDAGK